MFSAAVKANLIWLTIIGVLNSGIGAYYYLRIIVMMYMRESRKAVPVTPVPFALGLALVCCIGATIYLGLFPGRVLQYAQDSAQQLVQHSRPETPLIRACFSASRTSVAKSGFCENRRILVFDKRPQRCGIMGPTVFVLPSWE